MSRLCGNTDRENTTPGPDDLERWLPIPGWPGYEVSDWGRVRSFWGPAKAGLRLTPHMMKLTVQKHGYLRVGLRKRGPAKSFGLADLVLTSFVGPRPFEFDACHNNGDPSDNRLCNLRWDTRIANAQDRIRHGRNGRSLIAEQIPEIWRRLVEGEQQTVIADDFGVSPGAISAIRNGLAWTHITQALQGWPLSRLDRNKQDPIYIDSDYTNSLVEIWRLIPGWPAYRVSNFGNIQTCWKRRKGQPFVFDLSNEWKPKGVYSTGKSGHLGFLVYGQGKKKVSVKVHAAVLTAFACQRPEGMVACHEDGDPTNNHARNLRWDTHSANLKDRWKHRKECR